MIVPIAKGLLTSWHNLQKTFHVSAYRQRSPNAHNKPVLHLLFTLFLIHGISESRQSANLPSTEAIYCEVHTVHNPKTSIRQSNLLRSADSPQSIPKSSIRRSNLLRSADSAQSKNPRHKSLKSIQSA